MRWNSWLAAVAGQVVTPNQMRRNFRLGADVPWGDRPVPKTQITMRPAPESLPPDAIPSLDPINQAPGVEPDGISGDDIDDPTVVPESLRSFGKTLYRHPAIKSWIADPSRPLDVPLLLGAPVPDAIRSLIEAGVRRRDSAAAIAALIEVPT